MGLPSTSRINNVTPLSDLKVLLPSSERNWGLATWLYRPLEHLCHPAVADESREPALKESTSQVAWTGSGGQRGWIQMSKVTDRATQLFAVVISCPGIYFRYGAMARGHPTRRNICFSHVTGWLMFGRLPRTSLQFPSGCTGTQSSLSGWAFFSDIMFQIGGYFGLAPCCGQVGP